MLLKHSKLSALAARATALVCVVSLLVLSALYMDSTKPPRFSASAETAQELKDKKAEILRQQAELEAKRNQLKNDLDGYEAQKASLMTEIELQLEKISVNEGLVNAIELQLSTKKETIEAKTTAIATREKEIDKSLADLKDRLRSLSKTTSLTSSLQLLVSTDSLSDYLVQSKAMELLSKQTQEMMQKLDAEIKALEKERTTLEQERAVLEEESRPLLQAQADLETAKKELDKKYSELTAVTEKLHADIDKYNADIAQADADAAALDEKIEELIRQSAGSGQSFMSGTMYWPAANCNYISSTFKFRWGRWHRGIDICGSGCYGTQINAAADGVVTYSGWMSGYGQCIIINHGSDAQGRNITTLYAHASALHVSVGQAVVAGQHISNIGTTGNVTGPHLHFEVRVNGTAVDPIGNGYISPSKSGAIVDESL